MTDSVPEFSGNIDFNAQHSPMGAFFSFTCGTFGTRGGFGLQIGRPGNQDLYIGVKDGARSDDGPLKCLPFYRSAAKGGAGAADFLVEQAGPGEANAPANVIAYSKDQIRRRYGWGSDMWATDDFTFTIYTPFGAIPDPETAEPSALRDALLPAIVAELEIDNTRGTRTKTAFFAMNFNEPGWRPLCNLGAGRTAFAMRDQYGVAGEVTNASGDAAAPALFCRWTPDGGIAEPVSHLLGVCPGLAVEVPAGQRQTLRLVFGCYLGGVVTTGLEARYLYAKHYSSLSDVLTSGLAAADKLRESAIAADQKLLRSNVSPDQQFQIAHATRSYYGSTQLLDLAGQPFWVVNEGEYCMMNTLDLSVDHVFWELQHNPWVVRNQLDTFTRYYSYVDQVKGLDGALRPGGISFTHDMGAHNNFSPLGNSSYELPDLTGCFSYMTAEQLCNWILMAACYIAHTGDDAWLGHNIATIRACQESLDARCGDAGYVQFDSSRCGVGSEITTYDSLDHSLAQTRNNIYIAVKCWASYAGLASLMDRAKLPKPAKAARDAAIRAAKNIITNEKDGVFPAVFETDNPGHASRILPAIEGMVYVDFIERAANKSAGESVMQASKSMIDALRDHTLQLLNDPKHRNLFKDGGIKLSSTSNNSWMSKIAIFQYVVRTSLGLGNEACMKKIMAAADAAHVKWQTDGSGYWACSDQFVSGVAKGSRYYPRIITAALWLDEPVA